MTMHPEPDILAEVASAIAGYPTEADWHLERRTLYELLYRWLASPAMTEESRAELVADTERVLGRSR